MADITIKQCDLCDVRSSETSVFLPINDTDVCVSCLHILKRAATYGLITFVVPAEKQGN